MKHRRVCTHINTQASPTPIRPFILDAPITTADTNRCGCSSVHVRISDCRVRNSVWFRCDRQKRPVAIDAPLRSNMALRQIDRRPLIWRGHAGLPPPGGTLLRARQNGNRTRHSLGSGAAGARRERRSRTLMEPLQRVSGYRNCPDPGLSH